MLSATVLCLLSGSLLSHSAPKALDDYKNIYEKSVQSIEAKYQEGLETYLNNYRNSLNAVIEMLKKKGDIDALLLVKQEKKRFEAENTVPEDIPLNLPRSVVKVRAGYSKSVSEAELVKKRKMFDILSKYLSRLNSLKRELTINDKLDEATRVNSEIKRVEFVKADIESKMPKLEPEPEPKPDEKKDGHELTLQDLLRSKEFCDGLVLYYPFDGDKKHSVVDRSGRKNHGKVRGAERTDDGKIGRAFTFDGKGSCIDCGDGSSVKIEGTVTISAWVKAASFPRYATIVGTRRNPSDAGYNLRLNAGRLDYYFADRGWRIYTDHLTRYDIESWYHVAVVHDGAAGTVRLFKSGEVVYLAKTHPYVLSVSKDNTWVGAWRGEAESFHGTVDEVMIWNRALSEEEIKHLYEATK